MILAARLQPGTGLAILLIHAAILAALLAQSQQQSPEPEPRWIALTLPAPKAAPPTDTAKPAPRKQRPTSAAVPSASMAAAPQVAPATTAPALEPVEVPAITSPAPDFDPPLPRAGDRQVREAIAATIAEDDARRAKYIRAAPPPGISAKFAAGAQAAEVPGCLRSDALKHNPPTIGPIVFGGILSLPWLVGAALTGKCK